MIKIFPDFVVAVSVMESILRSTYISSMSPDFKVNKNITRGIFEKVIVVTADCISNQHTIQNKGIKGFSPEYRPDMWNTRHYKEYFDTHPELFVPAKDKNRYVLNMQNIEKDISLEKSIRDNAMLLCRKMLTQGHYNGLLMMRYGLA